MNRNTFQIAWLLRLVAGVMTGISGTIPFSNGEDSQLVNTNVSPITLDALIAHVVEHNPELTFYRAEIAAATGERRTAATWANLELAGAIGDKRVTDRSFVGEGVAWSVSVRQPLEWPGRIPLRKAIANHQIKLAELGFGQFKAALAARARTLAYTLFVAQEKAAAAQEAADRHCRLGAVPIATYVELQKQYLDAVEALLDTRREALEAAQELQRLTGLDFKGVGNSDAP